MAKRDVGDLVEGSLVLQGISLRLIHPDLAGICYSLTKENHFCKFRGVKEIQLFDILESVHSDVFIPGLRVLCFVFLSVTLITEKND